jgi:hypothetical protein
MRKRLENNFAIVLLLGGKGYEKRHLEPSNDMPLAGAFFGFNSPEAK